MSSPVAAALGREEVSEPQFKLLRFNQIKIGEATPYLVKGLIPKCGLTVVWGPPKCGKWFWTFDLMMHVALGWDYRGRRVQQGPVVYLALEGLEGLKGRAEAFRNKIGDDEVDIPLFVVGPPLNLVQDHVALIQCIKSQIGMILPGAVVIDTVNRSLLGSESSDQDMAAYIQAADAVREAFGCAVILIHHCGIDSSRPRGHTSLTGAADCQITVKRDSENNILATVEFMKDGPEGDQIVSRLQQVDVSPPRRTKFVKVRCSPEMFALGED